MTPTSDAPPPDAREHQPLEDTHARTARLAALGEIATAIAHELRNALQVIVSNAYLAKQNPAASAAQLVLIDRNARLAQGIVDDLMALARGEARDAETVQIARLVELAREDLDLHGATFHDAIAPPDLEIVAQARLFSRCLRALYENAILASRGRTATIETRATRSANTILLEVSDDGPGVAPSMTDKIFEPLVTGRSTGTGLGLALAKRIVEAHSGAITLVPAPPSGGATFRIALPAH